MLEQGKIPYEAIDRWIEEHKEQLIEDVKLLSSIKSVSQAQPENKEEPYGAGCRQALDAALGLAKKYGFVVTDYDHYCGTAILPGETEEQIGFFGHMDVVPEGTDWNSDPYVPFVDGNYLVGRGTSDNKGPAMAAFYALRCIKELGLPHKHSGFMFFGCRGNRHGRHPLLPQQDPAAQVLPHPRRFLLGVARGKGHPGRGPFLRPERLQPEGL